MAQLITHKNITYNSELNKVYYKQRQRRSVLMTSDNNHSKLNTLK
jgi:hypothetical protein